MPSPTRESATASRISRAAASVLTEQRADPRNSNPSCRPYASATAARSPTGAPPPRGGPGRRPPGPPARGGGGGAPRLQEGGHGDDVGRADRPGPAAEVV